MEIDAESTYDLRRRLLREGRSDAEVDFAEDHLPGAMHLGVVDDQGALVAVASFSPRPAPHRPGARAVQVRGMAVEPQLQRNGLGRLLLEEGAERLRPRGAEVLWANGRDSVLGFYQRLGWQVVGEGFVFAGVPHHVVMTTV
ncbi:MAG: GNAT family N-acetyltransferase [Actinomycetota bacterium]|nr:GNAT family N-acetyltransferase [Actinomycetota bacterium]